MKLVRYCHNQFVFFPVWLVLLACGSGGGQPDDPMNLPDAGGSDASSDAMPGPGGAIVFPPRRGLTNQTTLRVRGTAAASVAVASVRVNGTSATSSDGFATWQANVPLVAGENFLSLEVEDVAGAITTLDNVVAVVMSPVVLDQPRFLALDNASRTIFVTDEALSAVVAIDVATGTHTIVSDSSTGTGPMFTSASGLDMDVARSRVIVSDRGLGAVFAVDVANGDRSIVSSTTLGTGPHLTSPGDTVIDVANDSALIVDTAQAGIYAVELATGNRSVIASSSVGTGPVLGAPRGLALNQPDNILLVTDLSPPALVAIDLTTGARTIVSSSTVGAGPLLRMPLSVAVSSTPGFALIVDADWRGVVRVNLLTGEREVLSTGFVNNDPSPLFDGAGPRFSTTVDAVVTDPMTGQAWVIDSGWDQIFTVDPDSGRRSLLNGDTSLVPRAMVTDGDNKLWIADSHLRGVLETDLRTGTSTVLSDLGIGQGPEISAPNALIFDRTNNRLLLPDSADYDDNDWRSAITEVSLQTGNRAFISSTGLLSPRVGLGIQLTDVAGLVSVNDRLVTTLNYRGDDCHSGDVIEIDPTTGDRESISSTSECDRAQPSGNSPRYPGNGPFLPDLTSLILAPDGLHVIAADREIWALLRVNLMTGDRTIISDSATGSGPALGRIEDMILDDDNVDTVLALSEWDNTIFSVDLATGNRVVLADNNSGNGPALQRPKSLALDPAEGVILVGNGHVGGILGGVLMLDRHTGERLLIWP